MSLHLRSSRISVPLWRARSGFTLLELMVVCAVIVIVTTMAFSGFRYMTAVMNKAINVTKARENLTIVMDQLTKELREVTTVDDAHNPPNLIATNDGSRVDYDVTLPAVPTTADTTRGVADVLTVPANYGTLGSGATYTFLTSVGTPPNGIVLEFFTIDTSGTPAKHRIRYSVTAPKVGSTYAGIGQQFWGTSTTEPCNITYCNNTWNSATSSWSSEAPQPMTDQVVTGFTVTRPAWSSNVVQITLEAQVRGLSGTTGYSTVRLIGLVTVRQ
ncbi:type II secretion system protein J [Candidatus Cryosericum hinesii]|jgi:prepilin-type N-terminal cleavage/methylation domain-containing protein|nr:prepilin-type N-terminal cleavage/methylation domain-containing protein [Candidatus Cryosericum hinesii]